MSFASCDLLEGRLDLFYDSIQVCCGYNTSPISIPIEQFDIRDLPALRENARRRRFHQALSILE